MSTSWDPWTGGSLSWLRCENLLETRFLGRSRQVDLLSPWVGGYLNRLRCDNLPGIRSLGRLRQVDLLVLQAGAGHPQGLQHD